MGVVEAILAAIALNKVQVLCGIIASKKSDRYYRSKLTKSDRYISGLINITGFRFSDNLGKLYENTVFLSLLEGGKEVYYYKNRGECDFLIKEGQRVVRAIQVSYQIKENREREVSGLIEAMDAFKLKEGLIITEDMEEEENIGGRRIVYMPLWKWLLNV